MTTLYELTKNDAELYELLSGDDDIPEDQLYGMLEASEEAIHIKAARVIAVIKNLEHDATGHTEIAKKHQTKAKSLTNSAERLRNYLLMCMQAASVDKVGTLEHSAKIPKPRASLKIEDASLIPEDFKTIVESVNIDNAAIKKLLESGGEVAGAYLDCRMTLKVE